MKEIKLTKGFVSIVDDEDYEELSKYKWHCFGSGYAGRDVSGILGKKKISLHSQIAGRKEGLEIDHINGNKLDNRRENLRHVTKAQNQQNQKSNRTGVSSCYKGVSWLNRERLWKAGIMIGGKNIHIGGYKSEIEAALAYNKAAEKYFGEYARLNNVQGGLSQCLSHEEIT